MKKFNWNLQKLLDVTEMQEKQLGGELMVLVKDIRLVLEEIEGKKLQIRRVIDALGNGDAVKRIVRVETFIRQSDVVTREIQELETREAQLKDEQKIKTEEFLKKRRSIKALERLRQEAYGLHKKEQDLHEQKRLDSVGGISFAKKARFRKDQTPSIGAA